MVFSTGLVRATCSPGFCYKSAGELIYRFSQSNLFSRFLLLPHAPVDFPKGLVRATFSPGLCPYPAGGLLYRFSQSNLFSRFFLLPPAGELLYRFSQSNLFYRFLLLLHLPVDFSTGLVRLLFLQGSVPTLLVDF